MDQIKYLIENSTAKPPELMSELFDLFLPRIELIHDDKMELYKLLLKLDVKSKEYCSNIVVGKSGSYFTVKGWEQNVREDLRPLALRIMIAIFVIEILYIINSWNFEDINGFIKYLNEFYKMTGFPEEFLKKLPSLIKDDGIRAIVVSILDEYLTRKKSLKKAKKVLREALIGKTTSIKGPLILLFVGYFARKRGNYVAKFDSN